ncbi:Crp/Fnr family transcriptional regulator [Malaciobacter mytili LMG 24559]|uniref:Crp/Fnr family transcriptional regulator n=1 Tax=Malaciobacter mytili LMG 24559 TaxID=1032238 RepID=A0AAX2AES0_9BACT|nr:Crp/Fnr family transcriptional regulator [Malaciobacter mytili]AXH15409.1 transcriptional regulator, Crp/Fnr family [Malaciobacter mytili LMG 24559]RXK14706.1 Crp/Fnr family transcriptional regulator [Malaciobacter mytili LMG 24559]
MNNQTYFLQLRTAINSYSFISDETFEEFKNFCYLKKVKKGENLLLLGDKAKFIHFICKGLLRTYFLDEKANTYNKNLFCENFFSASVVSLLTEENSYLCIEALEDSIVIDIDFKEYKALINKKEDLKNFYIKYIEKNWIIEKEKVEISFAVDDATKRYLNFIKKYPNIENRVAQHHIASHLGITPTQLSRIRKSMNICK